MIWISPSAKDHDTAALEKRLWDAADQFRANSGLIFLRFAEVRFNAQRLRPAAATGRFDFVLANQLSTGAANKS